MHLVCIDKPRERCEGGRPGSTKAAARFEERPSRGAHAQGLLFRGGDCDYVRARYSCISWPSGGHLHTMNPRAVVCDPRVWARKSGRGDRAPPPSSRGSSSLRELQYTGHAQAETKKQSAARGAARANRSRLGRIAPRRRPGPAGSVQEGRSGCPALGIAPTGSR